MTDSFSTDKQKLIQRELSELGVPITNLSVQKDNKEKTTEEELYELVDIQEETIKFQEEVMKSNKETYEKHLALKEILVDRQRELLGLQEKTIKLQKTYERVTTIGFWIMSALCMFTLIFLT